MRYAFTFVAAILGLAFIHASNALAADEKVNDVAVGYIHSVDLKAGTFVLGGRNERLWTFRFGVNVGEREADVLLDGKKAKSLKAAIKPGCKASVASVTVGKDLWVTKLEVASAAKDGKDGKVKSQVMEGYIHSADLKAGTFVIGGRNESQTTFRVGVKTGEKRADCLLLLDGKMAKPETAIKPGRKATVTYVKVGDDLGASKLEITSEAK